MSAVVLAVCLALPLRRPDSGRAVGGRARLPAHLPAHLPPGQQPGGHPRQRAASAWHALLGSTDPSVATLVASILILAIGGTAAYLLTRRRH